MKAAAARDAARCDGICQHCGPVKMEDVCDQCHHLFGDLEADDANGQNCTCANCGNNTYYKGCPICGDPIQDDVPPPSQA